MVHWHSFRQIPTFGKDTIRRFSTNISELKRLAARDFEDILQVCGVLNLYVPNYSANLNKYCDQCITPAFDGLLPEPQNEAILRLLFVCANWHALSKLRIHTDDTLELLECATTELGNEMRNFADELELMARAFANKSFRKIFGGSRPPE